MFRLFISFEGLSKQVFVGQPSQRNRYVVTGYVMILQYHLKKADKRTTMIRMPRGQGFGLIGYAFGLRFRVMGPARKMLNGALWAQVPKLLIRCRMSWR